jgi:preprotein translocase subunit SecA
MTKGRNTSKISIRLPDDAINSLRLYSVSQGKSLTDIIRPLILDLAKVAEKDIAQRSNIHPNYSGGGVVAGKDSQSYDKVSRNALCPCGSGKKYKRCHGA